MPNKHQPTTTKQARDLQKESLVIHTCNNL